MSIAERIQALAETLDAAGKAEAPITVIGTRANLRRFFKPEKKGGAIASRSARVGAGSAREARRTGEPGLGG